MNKLLAGAIVAVILLSTVAGYQLLRPRPVAKSARIQIAGSILTVELAESPEDQQRGLSGRASLPSDHGMLFVFGSEAQWGFWMNGMSFPLDIIWFNSSREAVFIEQSLQPCGSSQCPTYTPLVAALYVLEVNANFVQSHNISLGMVFTFIN
jgi:uncharacterized membrane protein (UPF0127 family)